MTTNTTTTVTMYSTVWCGYCRRLKRQMTEAGIPFEEIDVDRVPGYDARIIQASGGYRTVPTLEVGGQLLVNPTIKEVEAALAA
ncbi:MAG TPA: glutaredoxin family protein [Actinomycetota bacterium]|nr:glutaredoxin family protein [Actinomycetota bacterium]